MRLTHAAIAAVLVTGQPVLAFGTTHLLGQNAEHERITRHALACGVAGDLGPRDCFQPFSLDQIAGKTGTWGAVGAPDDPTRGLINTAAAHCDNGDFVNTPNYPQSQADARARLTACRNWMNDHLNNAVADAVPIVKNGGIDDSEIPTMLSCNFNGGSGRAKCNVIEEFGISLHASQDFYAHSNWADRPGPEPISLINVDGLAKADRAPWLDLRQSDPAFPNGLMTGCYVQKTIADIAGTGGCSRRATHYYLNKDEGQIDPQFGPGTTPRGMIDDNFRYAVQDAVSDTRDKWVTLRERIVAKYGTTTGNLIICAITHDNPAKTCK